MKIIKTCRICKAVFFNKTWHHGDHVGINELKKARFTWTTRCPACKIMESKKFEGLITITNIPTLASKELRYLIIKFCEQAYERDCQQRLIEIIRQDKHTWVVTTTSKDLASKLARRLMQAFDYVDVKFSDSGESKSLVKIIVEFLPIFYHRFNLAEG